MYDVIIIGAGPAGLGAALYASYQKLKTLVIAKGFSSFPQGKNNPDILTYSSLIDKFQQELLKAEIQLEYQAKQEVVTIEKNVVSFSVDTKSGKIFYAKNIILAYGSGNEIGLENLSHKTADGKVKVNHNQQTNVPGLLAAGQVAIGERKDAFISASEGAKAAKNLMP